MADSATSFLKPKLVDSKHWEISNQNLRFNNYCKCGIHSKSAEASWPQGV